MTDITTVDEHIDDIVAELGTDADIGNTATEWLAEYGDAARTRHTPRVAAAGIVYTANLVKGTDLTQGEVATAADVSRVALGNAYRRVLDTYNSKQY